MPPDSLAGVACEQPGHLSQSRWSRLEAGGTTMRPPSQLRGRPTSACFLLLLLTCHCGQLQSLRSAPAHRLCSSPLPDCEGAGSPCRANGQIPMPAGRPWAIQCTRQPQCQLAVQCTRHSVPHSWLAWPCLQLSCCSSIPDSRLISRHYFRRYWSCTPAAGSASAAEMCCLRPPATCLRHSLARAKLCPAAAHSGCCGSAAPSSSANLASLPA